MADVDVSDLLDLARDFEGAVPKMTLGARKIVAKGAVKVKERLRDEAEGVRHAPALPSTITYDSTPDGLSATVGPLRGHAGSLALLYFGNSKTGPRLPDPMVAAVKESDVVEEYLGRLAEEIL